MHTVSVEDENAKVGRRGGATMGAVRTKATNIETVDNSRLRVVRASQKKIRAKRPIKLDYASTKKTTTMPASDTRKMHHKLSINIDDANDEINDDVEMEISPSFFYNFCDNPHFRVDSPEKTPPQYQMEAFMIEGVNKRAPERKDKSVFPFPPPPAHDGRVAPSMRQNKGNDILPELSTHHKTLAPLNYTSSSSEPVFPWATILPC